MHATLLLCPLSQRVQRRYNLLDFLEQNRRDWQTLHHQLLASAPTRALAAVPLEYPFELLLRLLRSSPELIGGIAAAQGHARL